MALCKCHCELLWAISANRPHVDIEGNSLTHVYLYSHLERQESW